MSDIAQMIYCFAFLFGMLTWIHGLWVYYEITKDADAHLETHDKIYKALEPLEDIEQDTC
jgi:hypothetical protein